MKSKRSALRFLGGGLLVSYKTAYDEGEARLQNVSTEGCAIAQVSQSLSVDEKILVSIKMPGVESVFQAQGLVVRVEYGENTAIRFTLVEAEDQLLLRNYFAKSRRKNNIEVGSISDLHSRIDPGRVQSNGNNWES
jgi:hypothetical protein